MISIGLQPLQLQNLHPLGGRVALLWAFGTWQRQDLPDLEKAFIHSIQHPFFITNCVFFNPFLISPSNSPSDPPSFWSSRSSPTSFLSCSLLNCWDWEEIPLGFSKFESPKFWSNWSSFLANSFSSITWTDDSLFLSSSFLWSAPLARS